MEDDSYFTEGNFLVIKDAPEGYRHIVEQYAPVYAPSRAFSRSLVWMTRCPWPMMIPIVRNWFWDQYCT